MLEHGKAATVAARTRGCPLTAVADFAQAWVESFVRWESK